jgi:hypothetical protein
MPTSTMPAYYLIMGGGSLTIVTSIVILLGESLISYNRFIPIFTGINQITAFPLTLLPGLAVLFLGQRFLRNPRTQLQTGLAIAAISIVSLAAIVGSGVVLYIGVFFSGPPISFAGGIIGAFLNRVGGSSPAETNQQS